MLSRSQELPLGLRDWSKGASLYEAIHRHRCVNISQISQNRAEQVGFYRFLNHPKVAVCELVRSLSDSCEQRVGGLHISSPLVLWKFSFLSANHRYSIEISQIRKMEMARN